MLPVKTIIETLYGIAYSVLNFKSLIKNKKTNGWILNFFKNPISSIHGCLQGNQCMFLLEGIRNLGSDHVKVYMTTTTFVQVTINIFPNTSHLRLCLEYILILIFVIRGET